MSYVLKVRGNSAAPILCDFRCAEHGVFAAVVARVASDHAECPDCGELAPWTPSVVCGRVKQVSVERGGWERPANPGYLDTRNLGEGQDIEEFRADRARIREREREREIADLVREAP